VALDGWLATLDDGTGWAMTEPALRCDDCSPWVALERLAAESGRRIAAAAAMLGHVAVALEADGHRLVCGQTAITRKGLTPGAATSETRLRWVRREDPEGWLWRATDGSTAWEVVAPPGEPLHRHLDA